MKTKLLSFICIAGLMLFSTKTLAQTTLAPGDIVVFWNQADTPDKFAFATFVNIAAGTVIYFTDSGVVPSGSFDPLGTGEGAVAYTAPAGGLSIGDIVIWDSTAPAPEFANYSDTIITGPTGPALSTGGDQVLVFQATGSPGGSANASSNPNFIFINSNSSTMFAGDDSNSSTETGLPTGLTDVGLPRTALAVGAGAGPSEEFDNTVYNGTYSFATVLDAKTALTNPANYVGSNAITDGAYSLPVSFIPNRITITTLSTDEFDVNSVKMYPNPAQSHFSISGYDYINEVRVYDVTGKEVIKTNVVDRVDISQLNSGLYLVNIISDEGQVVKKLMKQ
ncbi:T9SS type A sorting domain-containing protein [Lacinutrix iliipiscaria]|uniref:T9SS type A sorting domain-containing protein n=1 Tax=Lacinutrix iliipiscaria TaxID=1230532 RepID=A0ABW5WNW5_9FLAO